MADGFVELISQGRVLRLGGGESANGLYVAEDGVEGWLSTPDLKVDTVTRAVGDGGHDVPADSVAYASRTVTLHVIGFASDRSMMLAQLASLNWFAHRLLRFRVCDGDTDTFVDGAYVQVAISSDFEEIVLDGVTVTVVAQRPERLSWEPLVVQAFPNGGLSGGLSFGDAATGLVFPLSFGVTDSPANTILLTNSGSSTAYPLIEVTGGFPSGVLLSWEGGALGYSQPVGGVPVTFDSRSHSATLGGVDVSRFLSRRDFPVVPAGGSLSVRLLSAGSGWVTFTVHDTYI